MVRFSRDPVTSSAVASALRCLGRKAEHEVAQRSIEVFIGRLITDEGFRQAFVIDAAAAIRGFVDTGQQLTAVEVAALAGMKPEFWDFVADQVDPRLQKVCLQSVSPRD